MTVEHAVWADWRRVRASELPATARIYLGHETCEHLLPPVSTALELARAARDLGTRLTLACPFLTEPGIAAALRLTEALQRTVDHVEVAASDWGLLSRVRGSGATPVLGRLLTAQVTDPRLLRLLRPEDGFEREREVVHADGTRCVLRRRRPSAALAHHYQSVWCDRPDAAAFLAALGITRCELSCPQHGLALDAASPLRYSIHVPDALVAAMRRCPAGDHDRDAAVRCRSLSCTGDEVTWRCGGLELIRIDNALYHRSSAAPACHAPGAVDRVVDHALLRS